VLTATLSLAPPPRFVRKRSLAVGLAGLALFVVLGILVHLRLLAGIDLFLIRLKQPLAGAGLDALAQLAALLISSEFSVVFAAIGTALLWRAGAGWWSLGTFGFAVLEPVELGLKLIVHQRPPPPEFYRQIYYPLTGVTLTGSFPSGHAMRSAFFFVLLATLVGASQSLPGRFGQLGVRAIQLGCVLAAVTLGFSRIYLGYHWPSDVLAGLILGATAGYVCAAVTTAASARYPHRLAVERRSR
jgi:membrane-associated phospholipid phosphatase